MSAHRTMPDHEYQLMAELEWDHWWYRGLRDLIGRVLKTQGFLERSDLRVLDAGCGTGANLQYVGDLLRTAYLGGFDVSPLAIDYSRRRLPQADLYWGDLRDPPCHVADYDLILSCDVLYMIGMRQSRRGMRQLVQHLRGDGLLILNLPAYRWLFSAHDLAVRTRERTTASALRAFLCELGLELILSSYRLFTLFPAVVAARLPSILWRRNPSSVRSDLRRAHPVLNRCLFRALQAENIWIARGGWLPWGSSVFAVARRARTNC